MTAYAYWKIGRDVARALAASSIVLAALALVAMVT
jgi:hypothetical protein